MADIQKINVNNTTYDISTTWEKVTGKPNYYEFSTQRDFGSGTLIKTNINYDVASGDPFYGEIKGNTYTTAPNSCFTQFQGYIYNNTIIGYGVTHLGHLHITPITAMNIDGKLCFWFPRLGYWMGFSIKITTGFNYSINRVTSVIDSAEPSGTKKVVLTSSTVYNINSQNIASQSVKYATSAGNAETASKWATPRTITLTGSVTGSVSLDGSANVSLATTTNHTHTASEVSGLPTKLSAFTNDVGYITGITKPMVEGVLTGDITSHTHSQYLTSALIPAKYATTNSYASGYYKIKINSTSNWMLSFDVKVYQDYDAYTIRFSGYNYYTTGQWFHPSASKIDGVGHTNVKFGYDAANSLWVAIPAGSYTGISITNVANGYIQVDTYALDQLFTITYEAELSGTTQQTITLYPPSKSDHTHTFSSLTSKPTTLAGYGITDAYTSTTIDNKLSGYLPLTGGIITGILAKRHTGQNYITFEDSVGNTYGHLGFNGVNTPMYIPKEANTVYTLLHAGNFNSYAPTLTGTGASGTWGISISGNAATVGGYSITTNKNTPWGTIPYISTTGIMEVGKHFEFHYDNTTGSDYSTVLACTGNYGNIVSLPSASGKLALLTDNVASATKLQTPRTIWGQSFDGSGDVSGGINSCDFIRNNNQVGGYYVGSRNNILGDTEGGLYLGVYGQRKISFYTYSRSRMEICANGNILIGTTTDNGYKLDVNGKGHYSGDLIVDGEVSASSGFYQSSDERLKTFYDPIKIDLDKLSKLRKNYFKFKDKDKLEIGVSAQEIQSIYPEIVSTDNEGYLSVAYDKLSVIALAAIDELDNKYKKEINDLKDQLDAIKNILNEKGIV